MTPTTLHILPDQAEALRESYPTLNSGAIVRALLRLYYGDKEVHSKAFVLAVEEMERAVASQRRNQFKEKTQAA